MEFEETTKMCAKKLEVPLESAMPDKSTERPGAHKTTLDKQDTHVLFEANESTRTRTVMTQPRDHEDLVAERFNSLSHYNLVHKPHSHTHQAMKFWMRALQLIEGGKSLENFPAWQMTKVKSKKEVTQKGARWRDCSLCDANGHQSSQECGVGAKVLNI